MDITSSSQNGGESSVFDSTGPKSSLYTSAPSFGPSLHPQHIMNHDQNQSYVPKITISSADTSMNHVKGQHPSADAQTELITNLKVRIAVLENDLAHATKDKDSAINSSVMIARALGNVANNPELSTRKLRGPDAEEVEELRLEVKRLRRENGVLWGRIESREAGHMITYDNSANAVSKGKKPLQVSDSDSDYPLAIKSRSKHPIISAAIKKINGQDEPKHSHHPVDFNEETQLPNIVNLERLEDGSLAIPSGFPVLHSTPKRRNINDINTSTLDDVLGSDDDEEPEVKIEDQLLYQERANANFINVPAPAVLKAGFEFSPEKALRGDDYANRGYANRNNYYARFNNRNVSNGPRSFEFPPDLSQGTTIWATPQERNEEIDSHMRASDPRDHKFPDYFRYGIVYVPKEGDRDTLRGVHIGGLPKDIKLRDVLDRVRGGRIYSSALLNTMAISGSNSALVTFINQEDAEAYVKYAAAHPIIFGSPDSAEENLAKATVTHIHTPTFPFSPAKLKTLFEFNRTRILTIRNFPHNISLRRLETDLSARNAFRAESMLESYIDEEETLRMEFSSTDAAGSAFGMLSAMKGYREFRLDLQFEKDNCEGRLEELEKAVEKRKPMFPRSENGVRDDRRGSNGNGNGDMGGNSKETVVDSVLVVQRKKLAALQKQHDVIPSFKGEGLKSSSWADEVIEESGDDAPRKDEDVAPVTPKRAPRIITGKQYLIELAATSKEPTSSISTPNVPNPLATIPATPSSNNSTPRPRLTISTTSLPKITSKSPDPSSAEYSLHSFASSAVSDEDHSPQSAFPQEQAQDQVQTQIQAEANANVKDGMSEVGGKGKGKEVEVEVGEKVKAGEKIATKINPDEIDLGLESDVDAGAEGDDENDGLFQKELTLKAKANADADTSAPVADGEEVAVYSSDAQDNEVRGEETEEHGESSITTI
ncbi:hypothetical protein NHQ30_007370 [Ciborinia camelliae]|nr:hypothetical protein NHQ30_007370 [Ciborinia camelliae]